MNKIKLFIASMLGAIALVFACVLGTRVNAATATLNCNLTDTPPTLSDSYVTITYNGSIGSGNSNTLTWQGSSTTFSKVLKMSKNSTASSTSGVLTITSTVKWSAVFVVYSNGTTAGLTITSSTGTVGGETTSSTKNAVFQPTISDGVAGTTKIYNEAGKDFYLQALAITYEEPASGTYSVSYNMGGIGADIAADTGVTSLPNPLPTPSKTTGYTFGGWYTDKDLTDSAVAGTSISTNTTLYAKWTVNSSEWCTITFDSNGGSEVADSNQIHGSTYTLPNCTLAGYYLKGWSDGTDTYNGTYTVPSKATQTLTAQWAECIVFDESCYFEKTGDSNAASVSNDMFTVSGSVNTNADAPVTYNGTTYSTPLKMESSTTLTFTLTKDATIYIAFTSATGNCYIKEANETEKTKYAASNGVVIKRLSAGSYTILKADTNNIGFIGLIYDINKTASLSFDKQFDNDGTAATKLRFIGTIEGLAYADYDKIESITFTFTFNGSNRECGVGTLYKSITGLSGYGENAYKMYFVYQLDHVNRSAYVDLSLTNCKLTVVFTDGTSKDVDHADIDLPSFFDVYYVDAE